MRWLSSGSLWAAIALTVCIVSAAVSGGGPAAPAVGASGLKGGGDGGNNPWAGFGFLKPGQQKGEDGEDGKADKKFSSQKEKEALYEAYNLLHTLAQVR
jgi:hypothetical protein